MKKRVMCYALLWGVFLISCGQPGGKDQRVVSPDGTVAMQVYVADGHLGYTVAEEGTVVLDSSVLQWSVDSTLLGSAVSKIERLATRRVQDSFPVCGIHDCSRVDYTSTGFRIAGTRDFFVDVRVYNDGVAFRYRIAPGEGEYVLNDSTTFTLPQGVITWGQDNVSYYENENVERLVDTLPVGLTFGPPLTVKYQPQGLYASITEGGLTDFAGMGLEVTPNCRTLRAKLAGETRLACGADGELTTPWRIVLIGDLNTLVNSGIIGDVSAAPDPGLFPLSVRGCGEGNGCGADWVRPGRALWSWLADNGPVSFDNMKRFSKWAGELGFEYNLVDAGWSNVFNHADLNKNIDIKEVIRYGKEKKVGVWLWTVAATLFQHPHCYLDSISKWGAVGVKIDFFDRDDAQIIPQYENLAKACAERHLMVDFHGCSKPTGLHRAYPNILSYEAIRCAECFKWDTTSNPDYQLQCIFARMLGGGIDYTPGSMRNSTLEKFKPIDPGLPSSLGTRSHELALFVVLSAPFASLCDSPDEYRKYPDILKYLAEVPTSWDQTIPLAACVGEYAVLAKQKGNTWYIGGLNAWGERTIQVDCSFLPQDKKYTIEIFQDKKRSNKNANLYEHKIMDMDNKNIIEMFMASGGGFVMVIREK